MNDFKSVKVRLSYPCMCQHWMEVSVRPHASAALALYPLSRRVDGPKIWSGHF